MNRNEKGKEEPLLEETALTKQKSQKIEEDSKRGEFKRGGIKRSTDSSNLLL